MATPALPTGTLAFLFTDVEASTQLLTAHPDAYRAAVKRHHDLLAEAVVAHRGVVFKTVGDAVYAAFARPTAAVAAALEGQRALQGDAWGATPMRVRMGLHLGEVELQDARLTRRRAPGHGRPPPTGVRPRAVPGPTQGAPSRAPTSGSDQRSAGP
ncbi:MAG: adenylate/guanylate cyclase domain-containing protein [Chloroflexota bacterium]